MKIGYVHGKYIKKNLRSSITSQSNVKGQNWKENSIIKKKEKMIQVNPN